MEKKRAVEEINEQIKVLEADAAKHATTAAKFTKEIVEQANEKNGWYDWQYNNGWDNYKWRESKDYLNGGPYASPFGEGRVASERWRNPTPVWEDVSPFAEGHVMPELWHNRTLCWEDMSPLGERHGASESRRNWTPRWDDREVSPSRRRRLRHTNTTMRQLNAHNYDNANTRTTTQWRTNGGTADGRRNNSCWWNDEVNGGWYGQAGNCTVDGHRTAMVGELAMEKEKFVGPRTGMSVAANRR